MEQAEAKSNEQELRRGYFILVAIAATIVVLDQWTKTMVRANLSFGETWMPLEWLAPYARIINWKNTGAAFGLFQDGGTFFTILAIGVTAFILYYFPRLDTGDWKLRLAMGLQLGGALGNMIDRLARGYVTDFVSIGTFPVFNIADNSITIGTALLLLITWFGDLPDPEREGLEEEHVPSES